MIYYSEDKFVACQLLMNGLWPTFLSVFTGINFDLYLCQVGIDALIIFLVKVPEVISLIENILSVKAISITFVLQYFSIWRNDAMYALADTNILLVKAIKANNYYTYLIIHYNAH